VSAESKGLPVQDEAKLTISYPFGVLPDIQFTDALSVQDFCA
jgi:hypothetical protein